MIIFLHTFSEDIGAAYEKLCQAVSSQDIVAIPKNVSGSGPPVCKAHGSDL